MVPSITCPRLLSALLLVCSLFSLSFARLQGSSENVENNTPLDKTSRKLVSFTSYGFNAKCEFLLNGSISCPNLCGAGKHYSATTSNPSKTSQFRCLNAQVTLCSEAPQCKTENVDDLYNLVLWDPEGVCLELCGEDNYEWTAVVVGHGQRNDMGLRFNKFDYIDDVDSPPTKVLHAKDYPLADSSIDAMKQASTAISVILEDDVEVRTEDLERYMEAIGAPPTYPDSDPHHAFWNEMRHVVQAQKDRRAGRPLTNLRLPDLWKDFSIHEIAENVHDEYPGYWQAQLLSSFFDPKAYGGVALDLNVLPFRSRFDFVGGLVRMSELNTWAIGIVSPTNFCAKWRFGRPRPEEVAYMIATGEIEQDAPIDLVVELQSWDLKSAAEFTAYPEGSPRHPSWPAMHSAASSASFWMSVVFNLTEEQYCQALLTDYIVSYARTVAGVHYPTDNIAGLNLGQEILADVLVEHLVERYGANETAARAKMEANRFDWNDFDPLTCTINS